MKKYILIILFTFLGATAPAALAHVQPSEENKFGFLTFQQESIYDNVEKVGAGWVRPHPGPMIWGEMQEQAHADFDFTKTDKLVKQTQQRNLKVLSTLWPYAKWDQKNRDNVEDCVVDDEFVYALGKYRCNPNNWKAYQKWIGAVVERYDGDGVDDMPGLETPITHWEVNNEPDLVGDNLEFFVGGPKKYRRLLNKTATAIRAADSEAKVVIAGAAGGSEEQIDFYRRVLSTQTAKDNVDIGNVHCISSGSFANLNVRPYKDLLDELGLDIPIWVTEAETFVSTDAGINATQLKQSTSKALYLGADKIFFTTFSFYANPDKTFFPEPNITPNPDLDPDKLFKTFHAIIDSFQ